MFNRKNKERGFTLIELLIVIAIIGVLAATVVVSLGGQTDSARDGSVTVGVSSIRNLATAAVVKGDIEGTKITDSGSGSTLCDLMWKEVSGDKDGWDWNGSDECKANQVDDNVAGEICCSSPKKDEWVVWANISKDNTVYCVDYKGFSGELNVATETSGKTSVEEGDNDAVPSTCQD